MTKFRNHYNQKNFTTDHEVNTQPSLTIPDQSMTVKEIMERYARGLNVGGEKVPVYEGEDPSPNFGTMDLAERQEIVEQMKNELEDITDKVKAFRRPSFPTKAEDSHQSPIDTQSSPDYKSQHQGSTPRKYPKKTPPEGLDEVPAGGNS
jgi:hypothetical protein